MTGTDLLIAKYEVQITTLQKLNPALILALGLKILYDIRLTKLVYSMPLSCTAKGASNGQFHFKRKVNQCFTYLLFVLLHFCFSERNFFKEIPKNENKFAKSKLDVPKIHLLHFEKRKPL